MPLTTFAFAFILVLFFFFHQLPTKDDNIVFCPLTKLQVRAYQRYFSPYGALALSSVASVITTNFIIITIFIIAFSRMLDSQQYQLLIKRHEPCECGYATTKTKTFALFFFFAPHAHRSTSSMSMEQIAIDA
jgi:hypothetical protein